MAPGKKQTLVPSSPYGAAREQADIARQLATGFRGLRFAPALESAFRARFDALNRTRTRVSLVLAAVLIGLFGLLQYPTMPERELVMTMDLGIIVPYALATVAASWTAWVARRLAWFAFGCVLLFGLGRVVVYALAWRDGQLMPYEGLLLVMMMGFLTMGLTLHRALACCGAVWLAFVVFLFAMRVPAAIAQQHAFFATAFLVVGAAAAYLVEFSLRRSFLHERLALLLADTDDVTGLNNRRKFASLAEPIWRNAQRSSQQVAIAVLDLDEFTAYNVRYGHAAGDRALHQLAQLVASFCRRPFDVCGRFGGEEFVLLWPDTSPREAMVLAEQLVAEAVAMRIVHDRGRRGALTISVGVAVTVPADDDMNRLMTRADEALHAAKSQGRNRAVLAD